MTVADDAKTCVICGAVFYGYGNNALPVKEGQCCDGCNSTKVLPARINSHVQKEKSKMGDEIEIAPIQAFLAPEGTLMLRTEMASGTIGKRSFSINQLTNGYLSFEIEGKRDVVIPLRNIFEQVLKQFPDVLEEAKK